MSNNLNWNQQYRPRRVSDLHLSGVKAVIQNMLSSPHFPQVLLFAGPKGTGKTSVARIIGALLNDEQNADAVKSRFFATSNKKPMVLQEPTTDSLQADSIFSGQSYIVQELDAASNRGIDDVRSLKERSALAPTQGLITVYILDEVHMLTIEAFNALLKLLEEPPRHVVFILATTELHKVPPTIVSRCQLVQFYKASPAELRLPLEHIVADQKLSIPSAVLDQICSLSEGSFRDAVKLLQQASQGSTDTSGSLSLSTMYSPASVLSLIQAVIDKQPSEVVSQLEVLRQKGTDERFYLINLITLLHQDLMYSLKVMDGAPQFSEKITRFFLTQLSGSEMTKASPIPFLRLELVLLSLIERSKSKDTPTVPPTTKPTSKSEKKPVVLVEPIDLSPALSIASVEVISADAQVDQLPKLRTHQTLGDGQVVCDRWQELIAKAADFNYGLAALLRSAQPIAGTQGEVVVRVYYTFHKEQLLATKWRHFWDALTTDIAGGTVSLDCVVESVPTTTTNVTTIDPSLSLSTLAVDALMH